MGVLAFLVLLVLIVWLAFKLSSVRQQSEFYARRSENLGDEIDAVRKAFLRRISDLEQQVAALRQAAPAEFPKPAEAASFPPVETMPAAEAPVIGAGSETPAGEPAQPALPAVPAGVGQWEDALPLTASAPDADQPQPVGADAAVPLQTPPPRPSFESPPPRFDPPGAPWEKIDWEQWIGVRGAAVLGAIVLALAAVLFLRYSIEHGLIPPIVRVAVGLLVGAGSIVASERLRQRGYATTANALAGAGVIILYASVWAARALYELIGAGFAYVLMILVTVTCGLLSWRHSAREIAVLGLAGGFATPILLSTGSDNPIGLFAYVLMLDTGLLALARKRRWPMLVMLGLLGTVFYQFAWILGRMGPDRYWLGLLILGTFSAFFILAANWGTKDGGDSDEHGTWRMTQIAGVLLPFAFSLYLNADLGPHLYPVAILIALLCAAAGWLGRAQQFELLPVGASAAAVGVVLVWMVSTDLTTALVWEAASICIGLAVIFHFFVEWLLRDPEGHNVRIASRPAFITAFGFLWLLAVRPVPESGSSVWPWMLGWFALAALLVRQSVLPGKGALQIAAAVAVALGFSLFLILDPRGAAFPPIELFLGLAILACASFQVLSLRRSGELARRQADIAAATAAMMVLFAHVVVAVAQRMPAWLFFTATLVLALLVIQAATRLLSGKIYFAALALTSLSHLMWSSIGWSRSDTTSTATALGLQLTAVILFTFWPFLAGARFLNQPWTIYAAALAGPAWFFSLRGLYESLFGDGTIGLLAVVLGALSLAAVQRVRAMAAANETTMRALVWFAAVALSFVALAIPLQLDKEWITIGWAVQGLAILALWKRLDHPGLKYFALALLTVVSVRLVLNDEVLGYHARSGLPIFNWLIYTYLVPAAALLGSAYLLRDLEIPRRRAWEIRLYEHDKPLGAIGCGLAAILVVFVWINLTIFDFFSTGTQIQVSFDRMAARDLTLSLAWAVYALVLLGIGFRSDSGGLRWVSLAFLVLTIGKVFLHDLGELEDLYRVASLVGLALSLILVSLTYQRFVFRKGSSEEKR
ncbi:MAG: DUF2339 domain-containing protein [Bryobacterales bacterium]